MIPGTMVTVSPHFARARMYLELPQTSPSEANRHDVGWLNERGVGLVVAVQVTYREFALIVTATTMGWTPATRLMRT